MGSPSRGLNHEDSNWELGGSGLLSTKRERKYVTWASWDHLSTAEKEPLVSQLYLRKIGKIFCSEQLSIKMKAGIRKNLKLKRGKREDLEPHKIYLLRGANGPITDSFCCSLTLMRLPWNWNNIKKNDPVLKRSIRFLALLRHTSGPPPDWRRRFNRTNHAIGLLLS